MKQKRLESAPIAWIPRFWAQYSKLPEPYKKSFIALTQSIAKNAESREQGTAGAEQTAMRNKLLAEKMQQAGGDGWNS